VDWAGGGGNYKPSTAFIEAYTAQFSRHHYPGAYEAWSRKMQVQAGLLRFEGMGVCRPNQQVEVLDLAGNFRSIGSDPILSFPATSISPDRRYVIELDLRSDVESIAVIYFQVEGDERFSEKKTVKLPVNRGDNYLQFTLPDVRLKSILRIDPLVCHGNFTIKNILLKVFR
jgi:hypothetical protein